MYGKSDVLTFVRFAIHPAIKTGRIDPHTLLDSPLARLDYPDAPTGKSADLPVPHGPPRATPTHPLPYLIVLLKTGQTRFAPERHKAIALGIFGIVLIELNLPLFTNLALEDVN